MAKQYFAYDYLAMASVVGGVFVGTLLIVSILTIKISDVVLDSRVGALDRTLGFLFGHGRGLIIVVDAVQFFAWLVPDRSQPEWVRNAKSKIVLQGTGEWLKAQLPDDPESTILKRLKKPRLDEQEPQDAAPGSDRSGDLRPDGARQAAGYAGRAGQQFVNAGMAQAR
jgi:membrane protein required for colicin V production